MILAGDVGGTKTHLALFTREAGGRLTRHADASYPSREHASFEAILTDFVAAQGHPELQSAAFGIAGPVRRQRVEATNLPWILDGATLAPLLRVPAVQLLNDLEANAHGIAVLEPKDFALLQAGSPEAEGTRAVISAGTGLGEAGLYWDGRRHHPIPSEGGHADFSPSSPVEDDLLLYLRARFGGHVSWERVLSGPGLWNVYCFLRDTGRGDEPPALRDELAAGDPGAVISRKAASGGSPLCRQALQLFMRLYGVEAGNVALKFLSTGGLYVGGGIAPKNLPFLTGGDFLSAFLEKGRLRPVLEAMPVRVILNQDTALLGAAAAAASLVSA